MSMSEHPPTTPPASVPTRPPEVQRKGARRVPESSPHSSQSPAFRRLLRRVPDPLYENPSLGEFEPESESEPEPEPEAEDDHHVSDDGGDHTPFSRRVPPPTPPTIRFVPETDDEPDYESGSSVEPLPIARHGHSHGHSPHVATDHDDDDVVASSVASDEHEPDANVKRARVSTHAVDDFDVAHVRRVDNDVARAYMVRLHDTVVKPIVEMVRTSPHGLVTMRLTDKDGLRVHKACFDRTTFFSDSGPSTTKFNVHSKEEYNTVALILQKRGYHVAPLGNRDDFWSRVSVSSTSAAREFSRARALSRLRNANQAKIARLTQSWGGGARE